MRPSQRTVQTVHGPSRVSIYRPQDQSFGTILLGHGAGGGTDAADIQALLPLMDDGWTIALIDQPWRVAGKKVATPPPTLDAATREVAASLAKGRGALCRPWVIGGRSAGARVACRLAAELEVAGVLNLAFPLHPPGQPEKSRAPELLLPVNAAIPTLVVQGLKDPFGSPAEVKAVHDSVRVVSVPGNHSPSRDLPAVLDAARSFVQALT